MADYDLLWSTMTRYHGGLGGGDGYSTELPHGWTENQSRIADKVPSRLKCPISGELVSPRDRLQLCSLTSFAHALSVPDQMNVCRDGVYPTSLKEPKR